MVLDGESTRIIRRLDALWLYEVGEDYVLGARLDEMGVAHIQLHRLSRGETDQASEHDH